MDANKLSVAQYRLIEELNKNGKVRCTDGNRRTYKKLIEMGLVDYDSSYDYIVLTQKGLKIEL